MEETRNFEISSTLVGAMPFQAHDSERELYMGRFRVKAPDISNPVPVQDEHVSFQNFGPEKGKIRESGNTGMG